MKVDVVGAVMVVIGAVVSGDVTGATTEGLIGVSAGSGASAGMGSIACTGIDVGDDGAGEITEVVGEVTDGAGVNVVGALNVGDGAGWELTILSSEIDGMTELELPESTTMQSRTIFAASPRPASGDLRAGMNLVNINVSEYRGT